MVFGPMVILRPWLSPPKRTVRGFLSPLSASSNPSHQNQDRALPESVISRQTDLNPVFE